MADDPVTIVKGGTLAQNILGSAPEGMLIAPAWKRVLAFMLDVILISIVLSFFTGGQLTMNLFNIAMLTEGGRYTAAFVMNWFVFGAAFFISTSNTPGKRWVAPWRNAGSASPSFTITAPCSSSTTGALVRWQKWSILSPSLDRSGLGCATLSTPAPPKLNTERRLMSSTTPLLLWIGRCLRKLACDCAESILLGKPLK